MTRRRPASSPARARRPGAKLKSERIQGVAEKAPAVRPGQGGPAPGTAVPAAITKLLAQMPGWSFDPGRSSFQAPVPGQPRAVEIPAGDGVIVAWDQVTRVQVRLGKGARQWTKTRLEALRHLDRLLKDSGAQVSAPARDASPRTRSAR